MDSSPIPGLILFVVFLVINFIMYCFGEATQDLIQADLEEKTGEGDKCAGKLLKIVDKPRAFITTVQVMSTAFSIIVGLYQIPIYSKLLMKTLTNNFHDANEMLIKCIAYVIVVLVLLILLISIGIIVPQMLSRKAPEKWARRFVNIVNVFIALCTPISAMVISIAKLILRICHIEYSEDVEHVTEEEIISIVNEGQEQGVLEEQEAEMISNIIEMDEKMASEIMTHRTNVVAIDGNMTLSEVIEFIISENNSRFPVYDEDIDNIIGILHIRDAFTCYKMGGKENVPIKELSEVIREPKFIPETRSIDALFSEMQSEKNHMVIVIDEYGQMAGILTMEDILEEIVGNIFDEYDEEEHNIVHQDDGTYIINGTTSLSDIEDELDVTFNEEDYDTLNGYLISKLERIPSEDDHIELVVDQLKFEVLAIDGKMISIVKVTRIEKDIEEKAEE